MPVYIVTAVSSSIGCLKIKVMKIDTPTLKSCINKRVKYKAKGSSLWTCDYIVEVVRRNIIFVNDTRHFSDIQEIEIYSEN